MDWVIVAVVVVGLLVAISITGRQQSAVRAHEERLARVEAKLDALTGQPGGLSVGAAGGDADPTLDPTRADDARFDDVRRLVGEGRTIEAIKAYREVTHVGLAEAKNAVERMAG